MSCCPNILLSLAQQIGQGFADKSKMSHKFSIIPFHTQETPELLDRGRSWLVNNNFDLSRISSNTLRTNDITQIV